MDRKISRRRFVEQAGPGAATLAGAGACGLPAAIRAAGQGTSVLVAGKEAGGEKSWT